jgi:hypothetical protein
MIFSILFPTFSSILTSLMHLRRSYPSNFRFQAGMSSMIRSSTAHFRYIFQNLTHFQLPSLSITPNTSASDDCFCGAYIKNSAKSLLRSRTGRMRTLP